MPELPEVETVRRGLNRVTLNRPIRKCEIYLPRTVAFPASPEDFSAGVVNAAFKQWHRRGKYLLAELHAPAGWLGVHLRMTGQLLWMTHDIPLQKHCRVRWMFDGDQELRFVDQRTFGQVWWVPPNHAPEAIMTGLQRLGPEPFSEAFSPVYLRQRLKGRSRAIKTALLDQALVAGVGNIYADEALFLSGIRPQTLCHRLGDRRIQRLHEALVQVLKTSIESGGTTFSDFRDIQGINGNYGALAWVYDRESAPCRVCGTMIERLKLSGRSAHYCPKCQR